MKGAQTKHESIDPVLRAAGWGEVEGSQLCLEFPITHPTCGNWTLGSSEINFFKNIKPNEVFHAIIPKK